MDALRRSMATGKAEADKSRVREVQAPTPRRTRQTLQVAAPKEGALSPPVRCRRRIRENQAVGAAND